MSDLRIRTTARISEVLSPRTCRATLRNGKVVLAFIEKLDPHPTLTPGDACTVLLSLCDFSEARIVPAHFTATEVGHPIVEGDGAALS